MVTIISSLGNVYLNQIPVFFFFFYVSTFRWLLYNVAKLIALSPLVDMDSRELETSKRTENGILIK